jgi:phosphosulfolactate synthase (CoM biosynthesis protein A)
MAKSRSKLLKEIERYDSIRAAAKELCDAAQDGCAKFEDIQKKVGKGVTLAQIEDAIDGSDDYVTNVAMRVGNGIFRLDKRDWSAEFVGDE